jgi:hypothetical protein
MTQNKAINNALQDLKKSHEETSKSLQQETVQRKAVETQLHAET